MKIALVIVACDSPERLRKHLGILKNQTRYPDTVLIVNNGKDDLEPLVREFSADFKIDALKFDNIGPAGGFREGSKKAYADHDYIIFADDDAYPSSSMVIERFYQDASEGKLAAAGCYLSGSPILLSNHYLMVHRSIFAEIGFYFDPFFLMSEDQEYFERVQAAAEIFFDKEIIINHPWKIASDSYRNYLSARNVLIHMAIIGKWTAFLYYFSFYLFQGLFMVILGKPGFFISSIKAFYDFLAEKTGRQDAPCERLDLRPAYTDSIDAGKSVFVTAGLGKISAQFERSGIQVLRNEDLFGKKGRDMPPFEFLTKALSLLNRLKGRDVVLLNQSVLAFPPFSIVLGRIFLYDENTDRIYLFYRNNPLLSLLFTIIAAPFVALSLPFAIFVFFIKQGYYKKLFKAKIGEDRRFCQEHGAGASRRCMISRSASDQRLYPKQ